MKRRKLISLLLVGTMAAALLAGCGSGSDDSDTQEQQGQASAEEENAGGSDTSADVGESYSFAQNIWGTGAYPLDIIVHATEKAAGVAGVTTDLADNQFTSDNIISGLQSQLAAGTDGVLFFSVVDTVFGSAQELCDAQNVPYALVTNFPQDEETFDSIKADELFIGASSPDQYQMGVEIADAALTDGNTTAVILAAAIGDYSHDQRIEGFTAEFEANGGTVVQVMRCSDPAESTTKGNDLLMANQDVDCIYASGGDYLSAVSGIVAGDDTYADLDVYGTDVAPDLIEYIKDGTINAMNGGNHVDGAVTLCLMVNYLDGHQILDEDGKAPIITMSTYTITADNADVFAALYEDESCFITTEQFQTLLYRYNEDVSYQDFLDFAESYSAEVLNYTAD